MYFGQGQDFKLTTELSQKVQYSRNQATKNKWSNTACVNKWSFTFKMKLCVFRLTKPWLFMKVIRIFNSQPEKIPILRARWRVNKHGDPIFLLLFLMFISWMLITPSFKKSLIVDQFQGNYLKCIFLKSLHLDQLTSYQYFYFEE